MKQYYLLLLVLKAVMKGCSDKHLDVTFGLQVVERSSIVSVSFIQAFSHTYISFFHLFVSVTSFRTFYDNHFLCYIGGQ